MSNKPHYDFGQMGWEAFHNDIREPEDDPAFTLGMLGNINSQFYVKNPRDDWNEGWWLARLQEAEDGRN